MVFWLSGSTDVLPQGPHEEHMPEGGGRGSEVGGRVEERPHLMEGMEEKEEAAAMEIQMGEMVYSMSCIYCHGSKGRGDGAASIFIGPFSHPRPNDLTAGIFQFPSPESGQAPLLTGLF